MKTHLPTPLLTWLPMLLMSFAIASSATGGAELGAFTGSVVDPQGHPIERARVMLAWTHAYSSVEAATVQTSADGQFRVAATPPASDEDWRPYLFVEARGFGSTPARVPAEGPLQVVMRASADAEVTFVNEHGAPLPGVRMQPERLLDAPRSDSLDGSTRFDFAFSPPDNVASRYAQVSDARGICRFTDLPQDARLRVTILDGRFACPQYGDEVMLAKGAPLNRKTITLIPAATVTGTVVVKETGQPAAGIRIGAQAADHDSTGGDAVTDAGGRYTLRQMRPGLLNIALGLRGETAATLTARAHEKVTITRGAQLSGIDFELIPGAVIRGQMLAADNRERLAGVWVGVYGPAHPRSSAWVQGDQSKPDGSYFFRVPPGEQLLYVSGQPPPGFARPERERHTITLEDGETRTLDFAFPRLPQ